MDPADSLFLDMSAGTLHFIIIIIIIIIIIFNFLNTVMTKNKHNQRARKSHDQQSWLPILQHKYSMNYTISKNKKNMHVGYRCRFNITHVNAK